MVLSGSDGWKGYDGLRDWSYKHHYRVNRRSNEFVLRNNPRNRIYGVENFWSITKA